MWRRQVEPLQPDSDGFYALMPASELQPNQMKVFMIKDVPFIITKHEEKVIAFQRYCPHASGDLSKGEVYRGRVDCLDHHYRFDICTGHILYPEDEFYRLKRYEVKEDAGMIKVKIE